MNCCINCFNDKFLSAIIEAKSHIKGKCGFCKIDNTLIINPKELNDYFQPLFSLYEISDEQGKSIAELLKKDWVLFQTLSNNDTIKLLECILEIELQDLFIPYKNTDEQKILHWQNFKQELKHDNRYFPKKAPSYEHIKGLLQYLIVTTDNSMNLYRSRINEDNKEINISEMGKPPAKKSTAGRANPVGIPYLYTASNIKTAIAEIRPYKGDSLTIATFKIKSDLKLADLRDPRKSISPFELDEDGLNQIFIDLDYLCHLGEELSKPILPREAHLEYLSSQYLCELIKHCGFDGVIYKSSVGDGDNYAIFSDDKLEAIETIVYSVNDIEIISNKIS